MGRLVGCVWLECESNIIILVIATALRWHHRHIAIVIPATCNTYQIPTSQAPVTFVPVPCASKSINLKLAPLNLTYPQLDSMASLRVESPPSKRQKLTCATHDDSIDSLARSEILPHPLRIKPSGNAFTESSNLRDTSMGLFARFPDELILQVLGYLDVEELDVIAAVSKAMHGFSRAEELWKPLFTEYVERLSITVSDLDRPSRS